VWIGSGILDDVPSAKHIQAILTPLGQTLRSIRRPESGLTGSVFILETASGDLFLKVSRDPASDWKINKERIVYGLLRGQGIPAPKVLKTDLSRNLVPFAYTLSDCISSLTLSQAYADISVAERLDAYRQLGEFLGRMHSLTFDGFGDVTEREEMVIVGTVWELAEESAANVGPFTTWGEMHRKVVRGRLSFLSRTEFHDLVEPIGRWFGDHEEEAIIGHNEYDLMRTELAHFGDGYEVLREAFFGGYTAHVALDAAYEGRKPLYELSRWLVGLKCLIFYGSRVAPDLAKETRRMRACIHELMEEPSAT